LARRVRMKQARHYAREATKAAAEDGIYRSRRPGGTPLGDRGLWACVGSVDGL